MLDARPTWLGGVMLKTAPGWIWELTDWATVGLELAGLLAVWRARWFKAWLVALAGFHVAVALQMDIVFSTNVISYSLYVPWNAIVAPVRRRMPEVARNGAAVVVGFVLLLTARAALAWSAETGSFISALSQAVRKAIVFGAVPLAVWAWVVSRRVRHGPGGDLDQVGPATNTEPDIATATTSRRTGSGQA